MHYFYEMNKEDALLLKINKYNVPSISRIELIYLGTPIQDNLSFYFKFYYP
jgi:hypothetical protein